MSVLSQSSSAMTDDPFSFLEQLLFTKAALPSSWHARTRRASSAARIDLAERLLVDCCFSKLLSDKL
jgi:hypothetical protein